MKLYKSVAKFYDLLYSYRDYNKEAQFLEKILDNFPNPRILDVACGTGSHLRALSERIPNAKFVGIDLNQEMINVAKSKSIRAKFHQRDMRDFSLGERFDLVYCLSSSIQYNLNEGDLINTLGCMMDHSEGKVVFDLAFCRERWKEGYTNITSNSDERYQVAELFTSHSKGDISNWNPLYLIKDKKTGKIDMEVDKQTIRVWGLDEVKKILEDRKINFKLVRGFQEGVDDCPVFVLEGLKK